MRRLLSLLRSSQSYCTDNECLQDGLPGPGEGNAAADPGNFMMMMVGWMIMAAMMYFMRPQSMRNNSLEGKPQGVYNGCWVGWLGVLLDNVSLDTSESVQGKLANCQ